MSETLTLVPGKRATEIVKVNFTKKDGTEIFMDATKITTKPIKINFKRIKNSSKVNKANLGGKDAIS